MANLITLLRFLLLFVIVVICYVGSPRVQLGNLPLLCVVFLLDGVDGYIARRRNETSLFGAIFDISVDRVVENVLWLVLVDLGWVPVWVAIVFLTRSFTVDAFRSQGASEGETPFGMMRSKAGRFLVAGRFMRVGYGILKAVTFGFILMVQPWPALAPEVYARWEPVLDGVRHLLIDLTVAVCLLRGAPVIMEFAVRQAKPAAGTHDPRRAPAVRDAAHHTPKPADPRGCGDPMSRGTHPPT